jgi:hypothetical protein
MSWPLSRFRTGDLVEVCSQEEILATLDGHGCLDGMPFMPEMLQYCGRRFRVSAVAHKTCDTARKTGGRRLQSTVHLAGLRCDGSAHGGCQAECNLFWKDAWLRPVGHNCVGPAIPAAPDGRSEAWLHSNTLLPAGAAGGEPCYCCQATKLPDATEPLPWWSPRQYVRDVVTRNHPPGRVLRVLWLASLRQLLHRAPFGYRLLKSFHDGMHRWLTGRASPDFRGAIGRGGRTPAGRQGLKLGDRVRVKSKEEIVKTLDESGKNRGLSFDPEMARFCGGVFTVRSCVTRIIDEPTGKMLHMKQPCIMLEGVVCNAEYSQCRLLCPRAIPSYWREIWLEKVENAQRFDGEPVRVKGSAAGSGAAL